MNKSEAEKLVKENVLSKHENCALMNDLTKEYENCFAVYYQSKEFVASRNPLHMLLGHGAVLVDKHTQNTFETGSAYSTDECIHALESCGDPQVVLTESVCIFLSNNTNNTSKATLAVKAESGCSSKEAKRITNQLSEENNATFKASSLEKASDTITTLESLGFKSKQLWSNQC